jgi:ribosomal protein S18 acetylase RimI-like enzyme
VTDLKKVATRATSALSKRRLSTLRVFSATSDEDWRQAALLIAELKEWDAQQSQALGFEPGEVMSVFYPDDIADIRGYSVSPLGCLLLAMDGEVPLGCAAFRRLNSDACEAYNVYVRPTCRRRGIGLILVRRLMREAKICGYRTMCLETATFMRAAHRLYESLHFQIRVPYRSIPARHAKATMWMECKLDAEAIDR